MRMKSFAIVAALALSTAITGCSTIGSRLFSNDYGAVNDAGYQLPRIPIEKVPRQYHRQEVNYDTREKPGTIIVDTQNKFLYFVEGDGRAIRYGIGVGREGFEWHGTARIALKREWPTWTPPRQMIQRQPELAKFASGMEPGLKNPLGARAMYLFNKGGEMPEQVLDPHLQRRGGGRAARARPAHRQRHDALAVAAEDDVAAVPQATAGRTRSSRISLIIATVAASSASKSSSPATATVPASTTGSPDR